MTKVLKYGNITMYIHKESGNLYVKDNIDGEHKPVLYGLYGSENYPIGLRDYMNIRKVDIITALKELESCNAVLLSDTFSIAFYEEEDVKKFIQVMEA